MVMHRKPDRTESESRKKLLFPGIIIAFKMIIPGA
jgi:hypothetical protein